MSRRREEIVALGSMGYQNATSAMMAAMGDFARLITIWKHTITRLGEFTVGEAVGVPRKRRRKQYDVAKATHTEDGIELTSINTAILPYDKKRGSFSAKGDSGAIILDRAGRIVALLTGGASTDDEIDVIYGTPYWWLEGQIKTAFPDCRLY
ncbi:hypothetical protein NP233_g6111 [Leucocoprinus birnbaumii]|uniref:Uncharacterized protein n=1 Tax=Leucocoprinus birnbaumii TaxID=56174 RepID=A0AAD5VRK5_9AGAR|nr:hypothetical protein NP233_g6111 [Leucocoprinus birnbaumii]